MIFRSENFVFKSQCKFGQPVDSTNTTGWSHVKPPKHISHIHFVTVVERLQKKPNIACIVHHVIKDSAAKHHLQKTIGQKSPAAPWARVTKNVKKPPGEKGAYLENRKCYLGSK